MRTTRQQYLIKQLLHEATSKNLFTQSGQLYQLAKTALQSLNLRTPDIMRTTRQQYLIKQLLHEATSKNLFTQSGQLYQLAKTALQSLNLSEGLADITSLVGLATSMVNLSTDRLYSQTVPITTAQYGQSEHRPPVLANRSDHHGAAGSESCGLGAESRGCMGQIAAGTAAGGSARFNRQRHHG